jgi:hypothetical protein
MQVPKIEEFANLVQGQWQLQNMNTETGKPHKDNNARRGMRKDKLADIQLLFNTPLFHLAVETANAKKVSPQHSQGGTGNDPGFSLLGAD